MVPAEGPRVGTTRNGHSGDRQIECIVAGLPCSEGDAGHKHIVVTYTDGEMEHRAGELLDASTLAFLHGLTLLPTADGTFRWVREPGTWRHA